MMAPAVPKKMVSGRPRSQESHEAILQSTLELLRQKPYADVGIEAIASHAGVSKATIYRWWPNKVSLVVEVLLKESLIPDFAYDGKDLRKYMFASMKGCTENMLQGELAPVISAVIADTRHDRDLQRIFYEGFFARLQDVGMRDLQKAKTLGQLPEDADCESILDQLFGTLYYRVLIAGKPVDTAYFNQLLDNLRFF